MTAESNSCCSSTTKKGTRARQPVFLRAAASGTKRPLKARLDSAWKEMEVRLAEQIEESQPELLDDSNGRRKVARLFKRAFRGAYSNVGRWAWLTFPLFAQQK